MRKAPGAKCSLLKSTHERGNARNCRLQKSGPMTKATGARGTHVAGEGGL